MLAMTTNGSTQSWDSAGTTEPDYTLVDDHGNAKLGFDDAPALLYARLWDLAEDDDARRVVLEEARETLKHIRISSGDPSRTESKADRDRRIVQTGRGVKAREMAVHARCGVGDVFRARAAVGCDPEHGWPLKDTATTRQAEILRLYGQGLTHGQVAKQVGVSVNTVRRALGKSA